MSEEKIIMYGHPACSMIPPVSAMLKQANAEYDYINIHQDSSAARRVREINHGYESVPTLIFPDGSTLTEPSGRELKKKLESLGYRIRLTGLLAANALNITNLAILFVIVILLLRLFRVL